MDDIGKRRTGNESTALDPEAENCASTADGRTDNDPAIAGSGASAGGPDAFQCVLPTRGLPQSVQDRHRSQMVRQNEKCAPRDANRTRKEWDFVDSLIELLDCCGVLTDEQANILYVRGDVSPYFKLPEGSILERLNAVEMSRPPIRFVLKSMLRKLDGKAGAITSGVIHPGDNGNRRAVRIRIGPVPGKETGDCRLIAFIPAEMPPQPDATDDSAETSDPQRTFQLEQALAETREQLQNTASELETNTEELQASNEELNTVNDELRAKSEEADKFLQDLQQRRMAGSRRSTPTSRFCYPAATAKRARSTRFWPGTSSLSSKNPTTWVSFLKPLPPCSPNPKAHRRK